MKHFLTLFFLSVAVQLHAQFNEHFADSTLRLDYVLSGTNRTQHISLNAIQKTRGWYGRRVNMDHLLLRGNGQVWVTDAQTGDTLYCNSFSTLFQEWQSTEEATRVEKAFHESFLIPMPRREVNVIVTLTDTRRVVCASTTHRVKPDDVLIRDNTRREQQPWKYLMKQGDSREKVDIAFVAEGYTAAEEETFYADCRRAIKALLAHEPFASEAKHLNFVAVPLRSKDSGISIPHERLWLNTALGSHIGTFNSERYLTVPRTTTLHEALSGIPYESIVVLANTENYGGGGIFNSYTISSAHHATMEPVVVHEVGHSFGGLGDEYYYDDQYETMYPADTEPWEPNLTTMVDFASKWQDMLTDDSFPTQPDGKDIYTKVGRYEGGGYQSKGVYRPVQSCRMKVNEAPAFCPVCQRAIRRVIRYGVEADM